MPSAPKHSSPWFESVPDEKRFARLTGTSDADFAVVGAGIAGTMTAWHLASRGASVVLLEKDRVASGDTGFTTGFLTRVPEAPCAEIVKRYGKEFLRKVFGAAAEAQMALYDLIEKEKIDCAFSRCPACYYAYKQDDENLKEEWLAVKDADPQAHFLTGTKARAAFSSAAEAIRFEGEARFDARKFIFGLLKRPAAKTIRIYEESEAVEIGDAGGAVAVKTKDGAVRAKKIIITTGMPFVQNQIPALTPVTTFAIAARFARGAPIPKSLFWDTGEPYFYFSRLNEKTLILGGADRKAGEKQKAGAKKPHEILAKFISDNFSADHTITNMWSGSLFYSHDGLPYAGEHPAYSGNVLVATGFGGNGLVFGALAGSILADLALGIENKHAPLFSFERK